MAVSKIWKVTARLDQVIDYATNPEKTAAKQYSPEQYQALADVLQYAKDEERPSVSYMWAALTVMSLPPVTSS